jgi:hypothetical protein
MVAPFWIGVVPYFGEVTFLRNIIHKKNHKIMKETRET